MTRVPGARCASLTVRHGSRFTTEAATDETARRADQLQHRARVGPGSGAALDESVYVTGDVAGDGRWPEWGQLVHDELGRVAACCRSGSPCSTSPVPSRRLNIYSDRSDAFDDRAVGMGLVLATPRLAARHRHPGPRPGDEPDARRSRRNREIGVAMGILMQRHQLSRDEAFDVLRVASQDSNRKLSAVASEVADTGILAVERRLGARARRRFCRLRSPLGASHAGRRLPCVGEGFGSRGRRVVPAHAVDRRRPDERTGYSWRPRRPLRRPPQTEREP